MAQNNKDSPPTEQVNVWREDIVEENNMLTQQEALGQAPTAAPTSATSSPAATLRATTPTSGARSCFYVCRYSGKHKIRSRRYGL